MLYLLSGTSNAGGEQDGVNDSTSSAKPHSLLPIIALSLAALLCVTAIVCGLVCYLCKRVSLNRKARQYPTEYNYIDILESEEESPIIPPSLPERPTVQTEGPSEVVLEIPEPPTEEVEELEDDVQTVQPASATVPKDEDTLKPNENGYMPLNPATRETISKNQPVTDDSDEGYERPVDNTSVIKELKVSDGGGGYMPLDPGTRASKPPPLPVLCVSVMNGDSDEGYERPTAAAQKLSPAADAI